jgi:hypothetical protein
MTIFILYSLLISASDDISFTNLLLADSNEYMITSSFALFFQAVIFLSIITGAIMEYIDKRKEVCNGPKYVNSSVSVDNCPDTQVPERRDRL